MGSSRAEYNGRLMNRFTYEYGHLLPQPKLLPNEPDHGSCVLFIDEYLAVRGTCRHLADQAQISAPGGKFLLEYVCVCQLADPPTML